jgi:hypothetical protein
MNGPREPNARLRLDDLPGRTSNSPPRAGASISYRASQNPDLSDPGRDNNNLLKSWAKQTAADRGD